MCPIFEKLEQNDRIPEKKSVGEFLSFQNIHGYGNHRAITDDLYTFNCNIMHIFLLESNIKKLYPNTCFSTFNGDFVERIRSPNVRNPFGLQLRRGDLDVRIKQS